MRGAVSEFVVCRAAHSGRVFLGLCNLDVTDAAIAQLLPRLMGVALVTLLVLGKGRSRWIASDIVTERTIDIDVLAHLRLIHVGFVRKAFQTAHNAKIFVLSR